MLQYSVYSVHSMCISQYLTSDVGVSSFFQEQLGNICTTFIGCPHDSSPSSLSRIHTQNTFELNRENYEDKKGEKNLFMTTELLYI